MEANTNSSIKTEDPLGALKGIAIAAPLGTIAWFALLYLLSFVIYVPLFN